MADSWLASLRKIAASAVPEDVRDNPPVLPTFGTVKSLDPLRIALDSDPATTLPYAPACLDYPTFVGQRVWVQSYGRQVVVVGVSKTAPDIPVGTGALWTGPVGKEPPPPWMLMEGQLLLRTDYPEVSALYGNTFPGSTATHVALPDARGRSPIHREAGDTRLGTIGQVGGSKDVTLSVAQMPSHTHEQNPHSHSVRWKAIVVGSEGGTTPALRPATSSYDGTSEAALEDTATNKNTGGGQAHENLPPFLVQRYIVKVR